MPEPAGRTTHRVRYPETDRMGVAHHSHYVVWFELGRTELMRSLGCPYGSLEDRHALFFPVIDLAAAYRKPARYDQVLEIRTWLTSVTGARVRFDYEIRDEDEDLLATGHSVHASVGAEGKPRRLPEEIREKLSAAMVRELAS